jgi:hypothetical protein
VLLGLLVVVLLASGGTMIWLLADRGGASDDVQGRRETVMSQAEQFMLRVNTYGPDLLDDSGQMPDYRKGVIELITPKFKNDFEQQVSYAEATVKQAHLERTAKVIATGVSTLDQDSAVVLVAGNFTDSYPKDPKKPNGPRVDVDPVPFRGEVTLVLKDGDWLVDDFSPVTGGSQ